MRLLHFGWLSSPRWYCFPSTFSLPFSLPLRRTAMSVRQRIGDAEGKPALRGVVFDMDGTLTVPVIDFSAMYREVLGDDGYAAAKSGNPGGTVDILHHIETLAPQEQQRAYEIIADFERQGLDRLQIMPGAAELCAFIDYKQMRGLITRNVKASVDLFHQRFGLKFAPALSREFRPYKPNPAPLLHICLSWGIPPNEVMMIGDGLRDDVTCGKQAGAFTCLLDESGRYGPLESLSKDRQPDFKVSSLAEIQYLLDLNFELLPHPQTS
ncbi:haloacid dehalogenase-like hydrolase domain-containing protein At2g33255 isoform X2 [Phalaenopsis equestris]|uniref:haloacid dehalogenase-like hydrolase domain-containing protein At2g33255 isoform X2 n=1 Tax=Phalaenopsis equestris TaxID=78828 RepID=UPI0009E5BC96|nr:haloacid dehalogenase-like hydrolase domain-containing protein At2g33255 isoform X2 [Phalaenopsis equestris]